MFGKILFFSSLSLFSFLSFAKDSDRREPAQNVDCQSQATQLAKAIASNTGGELGATSSGAKKVFMLKSGSDSQFKVTITYNDRAQNAFGLIFNYSSDGPPSMGPCMLTEIITTSP